MPKQASFPEPVLDTLRASKILGVRAGDDHRYTGVWPVVVEDRLFVRSWNDAEGGWFRAFRSEPVGSIRVKDLEVPVRARHVRSPRLRQAVTEAYAVKYDTKASQQWVQGFAEPRRMKATLELVPLGERG
jgi:hypothetical protein